MTIHDILEEIKLHLEEVIRRSSKEGEELFKQLIKIHPADLAELLSQIDLEYAQKLFLALPKEIKIRVFDEMSHALQLDLLESMTESSRSEFLQHLSIDDLTDFFEDLSDEQLKQYLKLLHKKDRDRVLSILQFDPESAGGIMYTDVLTLMQDFTVEKSIHILQRLQPNRALHQKIYVTNQNNELKGHINLEDLVLRSPKMRLNEILRPDELIIGAHEDRQDVANKMVHYGLSNVPVVGTDNIFLGVIPSEALVEVIEEEASEDIYRMSALAPIKESYFETPFTELLYKRSSILIILLLMQTLSNMILIHYNTLLCGFLTVFISMMISTGGNASSQTSALAIQGMATGEIDEENSRRFIRREALMALIIGLILGIVSFARTLISNYFLPQPDFTILRSFAVSCSLIVIVIVSIVLGSSLPFILRKFHIDPAHSAGPLLTTIIDVVGLLIYCVVSGWILSLVIP